MAFEETLADIEDERFRQLCAEVVTEMERLHVPGVVVGLLHDGKEQIAGFGVTNVQHPLPVNAETLFQIGSITKTFVGTAVMRLVEQGALDLDAPLRRYLPNLRMADEAVAERVTLRHVLTHTGGWVGDYFNDFGSGDDALAKMVDKVAELPQLTPLGEVWSYNNSGFYLAGRVIEAVTGKSFEAALRELVLAPLGLERSYFFAEEVITHRFVVGHEIEEEKPQVARPWAIGRAAHPAGGLVCSAGELLRYARFHMGDGTAADGARLLTPEALTLMQTPYLASSGLSYIGVTWLIMTLDGIPIIGHGGGTKGQISQLSIVPSRGLAIVVLTNAGRGGEITSMAVKSALKSYLELVEPEATPIDVPDEALQVYAGRYVSVMRELSLSVQEGALRLEVTPKGGFPTPDTPPGTPPPPVRMALYAEDRAVVLDAPMKDARAEFLRNQDGSLAWMRLGGRVHARDPFPGPSPC